MLHLPHATQTEQQRQIQAMTMNMNNGGHDDDDDDDKPPSCLLVPSAVLRAILWHQQQGIS
jgi:hypothetical protein